MAGPLAVTSANLSGKPNSVTANQVLVQLGGKIDLILDRGASLGSIPSTVVDCTSKNPNILRQGPISSEDIFKVLKASTNFP